MRPARSEQRTRILDPVGELCHLRNERSDWLLTVLTGVLILLIFVFAPLQAVGITAFHLFTIGLLLAIIGSMVIISNSPTALILMSVCACCQYRRIFPAALLPRSLPPSHIGWRLVRHRVHPGDRSHSGCVQGRPCNVSPDYRSDPSVLADRGGLCDAVCCLDLSSPGADQGNNI
jgi:hypothetical protein